ncbi:MAG: GDP-mannose 4,6-dehydratase [Candidatus Binatia bacterium]
MTGVSGQDGSYLAEQVLAEGAEVFGLVRPGHGPVPEGVQLLEGDLRDLASLQRAVAACRPDEVYNLAAAAFVPGSVADPAATDAINSLGVENLAAALASGASSARLCHASSSEIFAAAMGRPCREDDAPAPNTPYGESKARAHRFVAGLRQRGVFACSAILFNHESPRRPPRFVTRKITMAAARIARGLQQTVTLGNLDAVRDWGYAPEYVEAMRRMMRADVARDYVVATGRAATVRDFARLAFARVGLDWEDRVLQDLAFVRSTDATLRIGDPSRIRRELGWQATTTLEELVRIMVDADLAHIDKIDAGGAAD